MLKLLGKLNQYTHNYYMLLAETVSTNRNQATEIYNADTSSANYLN